MSRFDLRPLLAPRSIAVIGASESSDSWAPEIHRSLEHLGFEGEIFPIHPKYEEVWGRPCRSSVSELPKGVDLAAGRAGARRPKEQAIAFASDQAERCGLSAERHDIRAFAKAIGGIARAAHDLRDRLVSLEADPLLVGERGVVAVDALAEVRPPT